MEMKYIRNFCIIAHIDHGKSTLADRLLEKTQTISITENQMLDNMDLERERGITIKSHAIQMEYTHQGNHYILNLIDTPGHVDFSYEVSRSIASCEGALLLVDATQGVQAQTISNLYMAIEHDLTIIPVINKCDMINAMPDEVEDEIVDLIGCNRNEILRASGRTGQGVDEILQAVVERIPHPKGDLQAPLQALIFDSVFNPFRGIIAYFKIENGTIACLHNNGVATSQLHHLRVRHPVGSGYDDLVARIHKCHNSVADTLLRTVRHEHLVYCVVKVVLVLQFGYNGLSEVWITRHWRIP